MSDYQRCRVCGDYDWLERHQCAPTWDVRRHDVRSYGEDWTTIHARDPEAAAEKFCERWDQGGDYDIIQCGEATVEVRKSEGDPIEVYDVSAESVPRYSAWKSDKLAHASATNTDDVGETQ